MKGTTATKAPIGIIANPASGRDIRRLTAKASVFPTAEKANMVQRVLGACGMVGVTRVLMMPDLTGIAAGVKRAIDAHRAEPHIVWPEVVFLDMPISQTWHDTVEATRRMMAAGVKAIVVVGGDGTHRVVASVCESVPLATLSSGTNNTFPDLREATTTGLAAALIASGRVPLDRGTRRNKVLRLRGNYVAADALVDICVTTLEHVGSRALWQAEHLHELFVAFAESDAIGLSALAGLSCPVSRDHRFGYRMRFAHGAKADSMPHITAPIAPGLFARLAVQEAKRMMPGRTYPVRTPAGTIALDGEREIEFGPDACLSVSIGLDGPLTIDVVRTLRYAAAHRLMSAATDGTEINPAESAEPRSLSDRPSVARGYRASFHHSSERRI